MSGGGGPAPTFPDGDAGWTLMSAHDVRQSRNRDAAQTDLGELAFRADVAREQIVDRGARLLAVVKNCGDLARDRHVDAEPHRQITRDARGTDALSDVPEPPQDGRERLAAGEREPDLAIAR